MDMDKTETGVVWVCLWGGAHTTPAQERSMRQRVEVGRLQQEKRKQLMAESGPSS